MQIIKTWNSNMNKQNFHSHINSVHKMTLSKTKNREKAENKEREREKTQPNLLGCCLSNTQGGL